MELQGERLIPAPVEATWAALNDPEALKACIGGCESLERTGDNTFQALMAVKVGPVSARFKGRLELRDVTPPTSYTLVFDGSGGVAGFGKGTADVKLAPEGSQTRLTYVAHAQVGGKIAQIGSRLVDAAAAKVAEDFFKAFEERLRQEAGEAAAAAAGAAPPAEAAPAPAGSPIQWGWVVAAAAMVIAALAWYALR